MERSRLFLHNSRNIQWLEGSLSCSAGTDDWQGALDRLLLPHYNRGNNNITSHHALSTAYLRIGALVRNPAQQYASTTVHKDQDFIDTYQLELSERSSFSAAEIEVVLSARQNLGQCPAALSLSSEAQRLLLPSG